MGDVLQEQLPNDFGRRVREIRTWRDMTQDEVSGLAGFANSSYLCKIEKGHTGVPNRHTLERLASALRCSPEEFTKYPWERDTSPETHAGVVAIEAALDRYDLGDDPDVPVRDEWDAIQADVDHLVDLQHVHADYSGQGELAPKLLGELHAVYVRKPQHRAGALLGLIKCYSSAVWVSKRLGGRGLSVLAAKEAQRCAAELGSPQWQGYTAWLRGDAGGALSRSEQYNRAVKAADRLSPAMDDPEVLQACGMLHLSAALAAAAQQNRDTAFLHLDEASSLATRLGQEVGQFGRLWFGPVNVGIWKATIGVELKDGRTVTELAQTVNVEAIPSRSRRAEFYSEIARQYLTAKRTRAKGVELILHAEQLAPARIQNDILIREAVAEGLRGVQRDDSVGRELRGLAYRLRLGPIG